MASNQSVVQRFWADWSRGDLDAAFAATLPDVSWHVPDVLPWGGRYVGQAGIELYMARAGEYLTDDTAEYLEFIGSGDRVVDIGTWRATARQTRIRFEVPTVHVTSVRQSQIVSVRSYYDPGAALRALGIVMGPGTAATGGVG
jgi:ketosteroid isomerase-like protein